MLGQRPIHPAVQRALFRKIDGINRLRVGKGDPFFTSTALEPQDTSNPIEQQIYRVCWGRVTAAITKPGVDGQGLADKPISFGGYFDTKRNTQINRPITFNKNFTKDNIASETFRGEAGITNISVSQKSFFVNQIEITWACPDPIDFEERIEPTFLRHGQLMAVEFGWGMDDKELDYEAAELTIEDMDDLLSDVYTKQIARAGSYYCNVGTVSNYTYKLGTGGGYTGTITLHTRGQNVMNQTTQNEETSGGETPNTLTAAKAAADNRKLAEGEKNQDGTFKERPKADALEQLNKLKETEASYQSVIRNLDKVLDEYLSTKEELEPLAWGQIAKNSAIVGATTGAVGGGVLGLGIATVPFAIAGAIIGTISGVAIGVGGAAIAQVGEALYVWGANSKLREHVDIPMTGYLEGLRWEIANAGNLKYWFKNGAMKFIVKDGAALNITGHEVPEKLQKKYLMSWGWFEDHILASFFNITLDGNKNFQEVRSVETGTTEDGTEVLIPTLCHSSTNLYSLGLDGVILPGKSHPKVKSTFDDIDTTTAEGKKKKLLSRIVYDRKSRVELARIKQIYETIDTLFTRFEADPNKKGVIRNMVFPLEMFQTHFQSMDSLSQGMRAFWADVSNQYGSYWNFQLGQDQKNTGRIFMTCAEGVEPDDPAESESHSQREDFINYSKILNSDLEAKNRKGIFVFPVYSKNSIVKSFDLSVKISSKAATIANYGTNTSIEGGVFANKDKPNLTLQAYSLLLNSQNKIGTTKKEETDDKIPILRKFKFPIDTSNDNGKMSGVGPAQESPDFEGGTSTSKYGTIQTLDNNTGINFDEVKDISEDIEKIRETIEEQRVEFINGIGIYDRNGNFSNYFKSRMKYLINNSLREGDDSNLQQRKAVIPIEIDMTIDGLSGLLPGDIFKVDYLPKIYRQHTYFQISNIGHTLSISGWDTTISAKMRLDMKSFLADKTQYIESAPETKTQDYDTILTGEEFMIASAIENIQEELNELTEERKKLEQKIADRGDNSKFTTFGEGVETIFQPVVLFWQWLTSTPSDKAQRTAKVVTKTQQDMKANKERYAAMSEEEKAATGYDENSSGWKPGQIIGNALEVSREERLAKLKDKLKKVNDEISTIQAIIGDFDTQSEATATKKAKEAADKKAAEEKMKKKQEEDKQVGRDRYGGHG